jgi:hypothetical protein
MQKTVAVIGAGMFIVVAGHAMAELSPADRTFATKAAAGGQAEVTLADSQPRKRGRNRCASSARRW